MRVRAYLLLPSVAFGGCHHTRGWIDETSYCAGRPTRPVTGPGPSLSELCAGISTTLCAQWARCGCLDTSHARDVCIADVVAQCETFAGDPSIVDALARGTLVWSGAESARFLSDLTSATSACEAVVLDLSNVALGRVGDLARCTDISGAFTECPSGSSCQIWAFGGPQGEPAGNFCSMDPSVTGRFQPAGERCDGYDGSGCGPGLRCAPVCDGSQFEGTCVSVLGVGADCRWDRDCASGYCASRAGGDPYPYSRRGVCATPGIVALGGACTSMRDCAASRCVLPFRAQDSDPIAAGVCRSLLDRGAECHLDAECSSGACGGVHAVSPNVCADTGAPCDPIHPTCVCIVSDSVGTCGVFAAAGAPCRSAAGCASGVCSATGGMNPVCSSRVALGRACTSDGDCDRGSCISSGGTSACTAVADPTRGLGASCASAGGCDSGSCTSGMCSASVCTARLDPTGHGRFWLHPPPFAP